MRRKLSKYSTPECTLRTLSYKKAIKLRTPGFLLGTSRIWIWTSKDSVDLGVDFLITCEAPDQRSERFPCIKVGNVCHQNGSRDCQQPSHYKADYHQSILNNPIGSWIQNVCPALTKLIRNPDDCSQIQ